jgi:peptidoglycan/LPS O-acetylase OafA/YrhL
MHQGDQVKQRPPIPLKRVMIPQLDTIRVLAMFAIFLHHLWKTVILTPEGTLQRILDPIFSSASDGVVFFNIISGFLLALPHLGPERIPFAGYRSFIQKRFLRIIPPYYLALLIFTLANIVHFDYPLRPAFEMLLQHLLFINSLDYSNMYSNFAHFWYLGQLAQFYLLFPLILTLFIRIGPVRAALAIVVLCWGGWLLYAWYFPAPPNALPDFAENLMHFNLPGRLPEFAIGMWLASLRNPRADSEPPTIFKNPFAIFTVLMILYLVVGTPFVSDMNLPFIHIWHVALSLTLFLFLLTWTPAARAGESTVVKRFSAHSYTLYIVHYPLFSYLGVMPSKVTHTPENFAMLAVLLLPFCYLAAVVVDLVSAGIVKRLKIL